jgi:hypothetical protein
LYQLSNQNVSVDGVKIPFSYTERFWFLKYLKHCVQYRQHKKQQEKYYSKYTPPVAAIHFKGYVKQPDCHKQAYK